jgi:glyoxylate reductase
MPDLPPVFVTRRLPGNALERLRGRARFRVWGGEGPPPREDLLAAARESEGLLVLLTDRIDDELIASAPRLRVISSCSVGVDHIDLAAAERRGIPVGHTPGVLTETTADFAIALLFGAARRLVEADQFVRAGYWTESRRWEPELLLGRDVVGATLGVIGLGETGQAVARRARGLGMRVLGWSRTRRELDGVEFVAFEELLERSDFVSVHVALTPETRGLLDSSAIARMRKGAILVNTSRGGVLDEGALVVALRSGRLAAAALDVFETEPLPSTSPLLDAPNLVLTPHIGSASVATRHRMAELAVDNLLAGLDGKPLPHRANASTSDRH